MKTFIILLVLSVFAVAFAGQPSACRVQRQMVKKSGDKSAFMPRCAPNGDYAKEQCRPNKDGILFCWCANKEGVMQTKSKQGHQKC